MAQPLAINPIRAALRHKWMASFVFLAVIAASAVMIVFATRTYQSQAKLFVRLGRENATLEPTAAMSQGLAVMSTASRENEITSVMEILHSRRIIEEVVDAVGPDMILRPPAMKPSPSQPSGSRFDFPHWSSQLLERLCGLGLLSSMSDRDRAIATLSKGLTVESLRRSNVITIGYKAYTPEAAQAIVAKVVDCYLAQHVQLNRTPGAHEFLAKQTGQLRSSLAASQTDLKSLMDAKGLISCEGQRQALVTQLSELETALRGSTAAAAGSQAQIQWLTAAIADLPKVQIADETSGIGNYGTDMMRGQLYTLQMRENELLAKYTSDYPELREIREQVAAAKATLAAQKETRDQVSKHPDQTYKESEIAMMKEKAALASHQAKIATLNKQLSELRTAMKEFNATELRHRTLQREIDLQESRYRRYAENLDQARIDEALEGRRMSNISVAQPASYEAPPVTPRRAMYLALALPVAVCGAFGTAFAAEYVRARRAASENRHRPSETRVRRKVVSARSDEEQLCSTAT